NKMTRKMDPIIKILYWIFLSRDNSSQRIATINFLLEGFGGERAVKFVRKYAVEDTKLAIMAKHCHRDLNGKFNIDWEAVKEEKGMKV
ncbi:hypothetical protein LCGC14_3071920, partial [marine sediment metagenome]